MKEEIKKILEIKEGCDYKKISVDALTTLREYFDRLTLSFYSSSDENNRLNNIIDELEKMLIKYFKDEFPREVDEILNKVQELQGSDKE